MKQERRFTRRSEDFVCDNCGKEVKGNGYTDHCPRCLYGKHVDVNPGDRKSNCRGALVPTSATHDRGGFVIHYKCKKCGMEKGFKAAPDDDQNTLNSLFAQGSAFI
ncbi:MAG: RNHCP domain-containing protein [Candidatus Micrarchaeales archaeon]|nr:RNHCP domain-containing protein [Candidatus Micrarchaeales archaeon]